MSKLNLSTKDVGKTVWEEHRDEAIGLRAKFNVKIPENAVNHLIKRWNDMEISVEGQDISAKFWVPVKGNKRKGDGSLRKLKKSKKIKRLMNEILSKLCIFVFCFVNRTRI